MGSSRIGLNYYELENSSHVRGAQTRQAMGWRKLKRVLVPIEALNKYHRRALRALIEKGPMLQVRLVEYASGIGRYCQGTRRFTRSSRAVAQLWEAGLITYKSSGEDTYAHLTFEGWTTAMQEKDNSG